MDSPEGLRYTTQHEWLLTGEGGVLRVGITDYAQDALGDIVFVDLPAEGRHVDAGEAVGEVESTKSVSDLYAPVSGTVTARNADLDSTPEVVNSDPYGAGWMFDVRPDDPDAGDDLLDADGYRAHTGQ